MTYEAGQVVRVPFPFTDRVASKNRPALVLSDADAFNTPSGHLVLVMITSARNASWPLDCPIEDLETAGLPAPSVVRCKLFTLAPGSSAASSADWPKPTSPAFTKPETVFSPSAHDPLKTSRELIEVALPLEAQRLGLES